jgi:hypothetical protein
VRVADSAPAGTSWRRADNGGPSERTGRQCDRKDLCNQAITVGCPLIGLGRKGISNIASARLGEFSFVADDPIKAVIVL